MARSCAKPETREATMPEAGEQEVNQRLRRADWRFLLPTPAPRRALCRASAALTDAVASIAGEIVTGRAAGDCDLVVAENPDPRLLAELREALRPGGACYTEWRPKLGGARRIEGTLRAAGFTEVTCYRRWPAAGAPVYWIPLGAPGAAGYVRSRSRLRGGRVRRLLAGVGQRARDIVAGRYGSPICAIARRPADKLAVELDPAAWLREGWSAWGLGPSPERLSTLLVTGGPRSVSKVVLLAFAEPRRNPLVAVKAPRVDEAAAGLRREATALERLAEGRVGPVQGVPRILFRRDVDGLPLVGETALTGRPLESLLTRRNLGAWSMKVTGWLAALASAAPLLPGVYWRDTIVEPVLCRFVELFGGVIDRGLLRECEGIVRAIGSLPQVPEQRDFGPWNLFVTPAAEIAVLDWESAALDGLPALDLLYYLTYASFNVDRAQHLEGRVVSYRRSLDPSTPTGAVRHACLTRYLDVLGLEREVLAPLRVLVWLIHAQSEFRHAAADAGGPPSSAALGRSLFLALWQQEVRAVTAG
jgi:hypothetical protein